jgi:hypothetical protein
MRLPHMPCLDLVAFSHNSNYPSSQLLAMSSRTTDTCGNQIKRIPVKEHTWVSLYDLKKAGQSYNELLAGMIQRERDYLDWRMITEIDRIGEFVAFDPDEIMKGD